MNIVIEITPNPKPITIKMIHSELSELWLYLCECNDKAFINEQRTDIDMMVSWHLTEIAMQVYKKLIALNHTDGSYKLTIKLTAIEQYILSKLFTKVECTPYMLQLQTRLIDGLVKPNVIIPEKYFIPGVHAMLRIGELKDGDLFRLPNEKEEFEFDFETNGIYYYQSKASGLIHHTTNHELEVIVLS